MAEGPKAVRARTQQRHGVMSLLMLDDLLWCDVLG
jgi:hypothetical protein